MSERFLVIVGSTSSGKSQLAMNVAEELNGEIISCDSTVIYKNFDIGTAKPTAEDQKKIPHHMIDLVKWDQDYDAGTYAEVARKKMEEIFFRGKVPIIVGGTGLYLRAFLSQKWSDFPADLKLRESFKDQTSTELYAQLTKLDPDRAKEIHPNDRYRTERSLEINLVSGKNFHKQEHVGESFSNYKTIFLNPSRDELEKRIALRTEKMIEHGLVDEVEQHLKKGIDPTCKVMNSIGYKEVNLLLENKITQLELTSEIIKSTRQYAKRQRTWFQSQKRELEVASFFSTEKLTQCVLNLLSK